VVGGSACRVESMLEKTMLEWEKTGGDHLCLNATVSKISKQKSIEPLELASFKAPANWSL
jgi:hypothetical protein